MSVISGISHTQQLKMNRALVIDSLRRKRCCSRAELGRMANLKRATITNIIGELIDLGLVVETEFLSSADGHRSIGLRINGNRYQVIGVMMTRTHYILVRVGLSGEVYQSQRLDIPEGTGAQALLSHIQRNIKNMIEANQESRILAIGLAIPGPYLKKEGEVVFITNLTGWDGYPLNAKLQEIFDIPVLLVNDANAAAYAQYWFRPDQFRGRNLAYIVAGQGIGCGLLSNGELIQGAMGIAGEIGHTSIDLNGPRCDCGNRGCLELYCSLLALETRIRTRLNQGERSILSPTFTTEDLADALAQEDPLAVEEYRQNCRYLAVGIVSLVNQFDPGTIVIGDQLAKLAPQLLLDTVRCHVKDRLRPAIWAELHLELDTLPYHSVAMGAAALASRLILEDPFARLHPQEDCTGGAEANGSGPRSR